MRGAGWTASASPGKFSDPTPTYWLRNPGGGAHNLWLHKTSRWLWFTLKPSLAVENSLGAKTSPPPHLRELQVITTQTSINLNQNAAVCMGFKRDKLELASQWTDPYQSPLGQRIWASGPHLKNNAVLAGLVWGSEMIWEKQDPEILLLCRQWGLSVWLSLVQVPYK